MTAPSHRISKGSEFTRTLKNGVRVSARDLVVHVLPEPVTRTGIPDPLPREIATTGGPWLGLIVSKTVGNAVIRHRVARRIRAAFAATRHLVPDPQTHVVVRAHRGAAARSSTELAEQLAKAYSHPRLRGQATTAGAGT